MLRIFGHPTREGFYYLFLMAFVFTGAIFREINMLLIVGGFMAGPMIYSMVMSRRSLRDVSMRRRLPQGIHAGDVAVVECQFRWTFSDRDRDRQASRRERVAPPRVLRAT